MTDNAQVMVNDTPSSLIEHLGKAFLELEGCKNDPADKVHWMEIEQHFRSLEAMLKTKSDEIETMEKEYSEKEAETCALISEREAAVLAKEQDMQDRVQELKDAAVAVIAEARAAHMPTSSELVDGDNTEIKVSSSLGDPNSPEEEFLHKNSDNAEGVAVEIKPRPELTQFCVQMDAKGLLNFTVDKQRKLYLIREELSVALESASEPARMVLDALEGFYPPDESDQPGDKGNAAALQGMRKSRVVFLGALHDLLARVDPGADHLLTPETKQQAKAIADEWKPKLAGDGTDAANGNSLEAEAFLQLIVTFRVASEFDEDELCKLVLAAAHRRQAPQLCCSLGLAHKMPGVIETLINGGKQIDAVHFIYAFQLAESYPPVPLLKTYLRELRRNAQGKGWNSEDANTLRNDANAQELAALKAVIRCVKVYKLETDYPLEPLQKRVTQLDRPKSDKKRSGGELGKRQQPKKPKASGGYYGGYRAPGASMASAGGGRHGPPLYGERVAAPAAYMGMSERYPPHAHASAYAPSQHQQTYVPQAANQRLYYYPQDERAAATPYNPDQSSYGSYLTSGLPSPQQPYM